jgi:hypothetical protein
MLQLTYHNGMISETERCTSPLIILREEHSANGLLEETDSIARLWWTLRDVMAEGTRQ